MTFCNHEDKMEIITALFIATLNILLIQGYSINTKNCRACSNRVDVPCHVQELHYHCLHDEFGGIWPGLPRNLSGRKVPVAKNASVANFTWNAPYDASYKTLNGFLLTVNIAEDYFVYGTHTGRLQHTPRCFFANLSGTNWDIVPKPHSVLFHFDCVTAKAGESVEVSLTLMSSPVPGEKSLAPLTKNVTLKQDFVSVRKKRWFLILPPTPDKTPFKEPDVMAINFTVEGFTVEIKFGPVNPSSTYLVCLGFINNEHDCYRNTETQEGQDFVVFNNVEPDTYRIFVKNLDNPDNLMYASKPFNVTEKPQVHIKSPIAPSVVAIITVSCLLCVAGVTTVCFCLMRERCHCLQLRCEICRCVQYYPASQSVPNNTNDEEEDSVLEILPLYYNESEDFTFAVEKICMYVRKWSNYRVNPDWISGFLSTPAVSFKEKHPNGVLLIILSSKMWTLLNETFYNSNYQGQNDPRSKVFRKILIETDGKPYSKVIVSLHPLVETKKHLKGIEILTITKYGMRQTQNILEMNTEELYLMLEFFNDAGRVRPGWAAYEEMTVLYNAIKHVPRSDLYIDLHIDISKDILDNCKQIVNLPFKNQDEERIGQSGICSHCHGRHGGEMCPVWQKQEQTYKWAQGCHNPYRQSGCMPGRDCCRVDDLHHDQPAFHEIELDIESASACQENIDTREPTHMVCHGGFSEVSLMNRLSDPKDDSESISWSVIGQRQVEIYQDYKATLNDTKV